MTDNLHKSEVSETRGDTTVGVEKTVVSPSPSGLKGNILKKLKEDIGRGPTEYSFGTYTK
jgi:hypothetical protein